VRQLEETYLALIALVERGMYRAQRLRPPDTRKTEADIPPHLSFDELVTLNARIKLFGSPEIGATYIAWWSCVNAVDSQAAALDTLAGSPSSVPTGIYPTGWTEGLANLERARSQLNKWSTGLVDMARAELGISSPWAQEPDGTDHRASEHLGP